MENAEHIINEALKLIVPIENRARNQATIANYCAKFKVMKAKVGADQSHDALLAVALNTRKDSTWQANKASLAWVYATYIRPLITRQDELRKEIAEARNVQKTPDESVWRTVICEIEKTTKALQAVLNAMLPIEDRDARHSKRVDLRGLPKDWDERLVARMAKYYPQVLVTAVSGCRPGELVKGITLMIDSRGYLVIRIEGAKVGANSGQAWRIMRWRPNSSSPLVRALSDLVSKESPNALFTISTPNAKAFSGAMAEAGKREWPEREAAITPYCLRHQVAADMKAAGILSGGEISAALGHLSDVTKSRYGHASMGRKRGGVSPTEVEAERPVKTKAPAKPANGTTGTDTQERPDRDDSPEPGM